MYKIYSFFYLVFAGLSLYAQPVAEDSIRIMFIGDIMNHRPQIKAAYNPDTQSYDYNGNFKYVKNIFHQADFVAGNLETTLGIKPYSGYPQFSAPPALAAACRDAGINVLVTANNHSCDKGLKGIIKTLDILDSLHIDHTGTFRNKTAKDSLTPLILKKNGITLALLNYTYGTNGIPEPIPAKVNLIDTVAIKRDIEKSRLKNPDAIIVFLHWGQQYKNHPDKQQKKLVNFLHRNGINIIIGSHPHVIQDIDYELDYLNNQTYLTVYSLGNFISNQRTFPRDGSMIADIQLKKDLKGKLHITHFKTIPVWVYKFMKQKRLHYEILPIEKFKFRPGYFLKNPDYQKMMRYYKHYKSFFPH